MLLKKFNSDVLQIQNVKHWLIEKWQHFQELYLSVLTLRRLKFGMQVCTLKTSLNFPNALTMCHLLWFVYNVFMHVFNSKVVFGLSKNVLHTMSMGNVNQHFSFVKYWRGKSMFFISQAQKTVNVNCHYLFYLAL